MFSRGHGPQAIGRLAPDADAAELPLAKVLATIEFASDLLNVATGTQQEHGEACADCNAARRQLSAD